MSTGSQMIAQLTGIVSVSVAVWTGVLSYVILKLVGLFVSLRVDEDEETEGLDIVLHEEQGYNL